MGIRSTAVIRIAGFLCMAFSPVMFFPILVSIWYGDGEVQHYSFTFLTMFAAGLVLWLPSAGRRMELHHRDGFFIVVLFWALLSLLGAFPFVFGLHLSFVDALFESVSGFTTTGATVLTGLDRLPPSILFYRQELQWLGGMGLIVLAVAVLPILGIGGMSIYRAEVPGPMKEEKLRPRLAQSARVLWTLYIGLTMTCAFAYWAAGMTPFDAIAHSLSTVSTGGFSTHDTSLGYFSNATIEAIATVFMLLGGINFGIHYLVWRDRNPWHYLDNAEVRAFLVFVALMVGLVGLTLWLSGRYDNWTAWRYASFEMVSVVTSTGFGVTDFSLWPLFLPLLLIFISFIGGCGGSTAGGMKMIRVLLMGKQIYHEFNRLVHPKGVFALKIGGRVVGENISQSVGGFFSVYIATFVVLMLLMMLSGLDQVSAFSAVATSMNNLGPGLGTVAQTFSSVSDGGKLVAVAAMLVGRLEAFTILVLLHSTFWRD